MSIPHVIFYDTSQAYYASYYLNGFHELRKTHGVRMQIAHSLPARLRSAVQNREWQHLLFSMVLFELQQGNRTWYICIDTHDDNSLDIPNRTGGYHWPLLQYTDAYFKVNYNLQIIRQTPALAAHQQKIHSIAQFFPIRPPRPLSLSQRLLLPTVWFGYRPSLGHGQPYQGYLAAARRRLRDLKNFLTLDQIIAHRSTPKDIDIFYVTSFRHAPRHAPIMQQRLHVMDMLAGITNLSIEMGFTSQSALPENFTRHHHRPLSQSGYLDTLARSKVVIYTQGMEGCISSKFSLAMALGIPAAGEPLLNNSELLIAHPHLTEQFGFSDPDRLVDQAVKLATDPQHAHRLGLLNAAMFDHHLAPRPAAEYILRILQVL
ncbi:hypothetical protein ABF87_14435 [Nitrosomonas sp. JL21]|uniref:hypothetical protein n=1 Tax=Nitrosomonas sp. JL21 TaxID=153949 RepID=UPI00136AAD3A|nr:hypothetical protein [Nitrosomonas sp. JL21]MBL8497376.1 hypothetical protein [Nitrosomonas sp.]MXS79132.1 hypothetical protein [Nitrosomonas sp. JL21]